VQREQRGQQQQDLARLDAMEPAPGFVPPAAKLTMLQMAEIEKLAAWGANLAQIGVWLKIDDELWRETVRVNGDVRALYRYGAVRGPIEMMEALFNAGLSGEVGAQRVYLERFGGPQWAAKPKHFVVQREDLPPGIEDAAGQEIFDSVANSIERQRLLIEADAIEIGETES
jgi:hypothetical protein